MSLLMTAEWHSKEDVALADPDPIVSDLTDSIDDFGSLLSATPSVSWQPLKNKFPLEPIVCEVKENEEEPILHIDDVSPVASSSLTPMKAAYSEENVVRRVKELDGNQRAASCADIR